MTFQENINKIIQLEKESIEKGKEFLQVCEDKIAILDDGNEKDMFQKAYNMTAKRLIEQQEDLDKLIKLQE